ncbi:CCE_0567 family metalloprotein [Hydrogenobacter thermophilus]|uniref:CCE_0567 family metalloprotein n=1 Tax=Hydrogenobacter thermophilus TaxID=940 RepID=UPI0030FB9085
MCEQKIVIDGCTGACKESDTDIEAQRSLCHSQDERFRSISLEELKEEVKRLRMLAVKSATELHDLAEEGLPHRWEEIPKVSQEVYKIHLLYHKAKRILEERSKQLE